MVTSTARTPLGNLPADVTSFVGRRHELSEARRLLSGARLVTLTGTGGVGKTRLALRVSAEIQRAFPDGVWLVELAELHDPALLAVTVAETLGIRDQSVQWGLRSLSQYLANRRLLLVIDNCEHLIGACAELAETLLRSGPELRILATSRQPLGITGEATLPVPPLSVPDPDRAISPTGLAQYEAANLLVDRATAVLPGFVVDADNCQAVARLVQALDGIPLAIELAAVRLRALSLEQIVSRLADRYRLLTTGSRNAPPRQQTLQGLIDWSYELCSEEERTLWARLSVFSGGLELDAAEEVCGTDGLAPERILDLIASLVDKSIIMRDEQNSRVRYRLLETIRQYGEEKLREADARDLMRRQHCEWYARLAARSDAQFVGPRQSEVIRRLRNEHPNLRLALEYAVTDQPNPQVGQRLAADLEGYWYVRGFLAEGRHWLGRALARPGKPHWTRAKALRVDAALALQHGERERAAAALDEAHRIAEKLPDPLELGYVALVRGTLQLYAGDLPTAVEYFEEALDRFAGIGARGGQMWALIVLGLARGLTGDPRQGFAPLEACIRESVDSGDVWWRSFAMWALGLLRWRAGDTAGGAALEKQSLELKKRFEDEQFVTALCLETLAWIAASERRDERAVRLLGAAEHIWQAMRASLNVFVGLRALHEACVAQVRSRLGDAAYEAAYRDGRRMSQEAALDFALEKTPTTAAPTAGAPAATTPLTRREREIADLVAEGMSNREIAAKLVIAQRTAEGHVEHILSKLGFTSRVQVAAWVAEQRGSAADD